MTSKSGEHEVFVWVWLPEAHTPVVAGKLTLDGEKLVFNYGKSYLERENAISIYDAELPLKPGLLPLLNGLAMPGCIRDASPDAWGRRVIINKMLGTRGKGIDNAELSELTYLIESGSDRIGALDFQRSPTLYEPRLSANVMLDELQSAAERVEKGQALTPGLDQALHHGSSIGGARPKALLDNGNKKLIAKFSSSADLYNIVKTEFVAMRLAKLVGLDVAKVSLTQAIKKDVLLVERFDRIHTPKGWQRTNILSALTLFRLDEMMARYASYENLAEIIRKKFTAPKKTLAELFGRLVFNILCGNNDDHARNHAAFWNGRALTLTPAYDICPQARSGNETSQAMLISGNNRSSRIKTCIDCSGQFLLSRDHAVGIVEQQIRDIVQNWRSVCDEAELTDTDRSLLWRRQFLNPYAFDALDGKLAHLKTLVD